MSSRQPGRFLKQEIQKLAFLKGNLRFVLIWPVVCSLLCALLWGLIFLKLGADKRGLEKNALKDASLLAKTYSEYLTRNLEQIDQITLHVKYEWELSQGKVRLDDLLEKGLFPTSMYFYVTIVDSQGTPRTSTHPLARTLDLRTLESFALQRAATPNALFISKPFPGLISGKTVIHFARRLETADGAFDGVVQISVEPAYFMSFYDVANLGKSGLLAAVGNDHAIRASGITKTLYPLTGTALTVIPPMPSDQNAALLNGDPWFVDRQARYLGWHALKSYPFITLAGLSEQEVLAPYYTARNNYIHFAIAGSIFLLLSALMGVMLTSRLAWRKRQAEEINTTYRIATEGGNEGFYRLRALYDDDRAMVDFVVEDCNERGAGFVNATSGQLIGKRFSDLYPAQYVQVVMHIFRNAMEVGFYEDDFKVAPDSPLQAVWMHRKLVRTGSGLAMTLRDITDIKAHQHALSQLANEDALTKLPNRYWLMTFLPAALQRAKDTQGMLALLFVDLDDFKNINDTRGHSVGDELLQAVALRLTALLGSNDNVVRLGGDEFTVIIERDANDNDVESVAARITDSFREPFDLAGEKSILSASIGISFFPRDGEESETILKNADIAMYSAKAAGRGQYRYFERELFDRFKQRLDTKHALQQAIENDEFVLYYQPRVDTLTGELCSMEALVRWMHPERGLLPPLEFIPLAEETGQILALGSLVMDKACAQLARWKAQNLPMVPMSVNVSARQFNQGNIKDLVATCLARHRIDAGLLEIELTESAMMGENAELIAELSAIRAMGIKLLVDDFGTGYSSLSQLQRLDMDVLKVDRAFTSELGTAKEGEVFFKAIVSMAHALGMRVVAEGVETMAQLQILQNLYCDEVQGYFIARPLPHNDMPQLMSRRFLFETSILLPQTDEQANDPAMSFSSIE